MGVWKHSEQAIPAAWAALPSLPVHTDEDAKTDERDGERDEAPSYL